MAILLTTDDTRREVFLKAEQANIKTGGSGTADHRQLTNRDADNQHPISAITGLQEELDGLASKAYADQAADQALADAKIYTDSIVGNIESAINTIRGVTA